MINEFKDFKLLRNLGFSGEEIFHLSYDLIKNNKNKTKVQLLGSGTILREIIAAAKILSKVIGIKEFNIGHFLIGESIFIGLSQCIKNFKKIIEINIIRSTFKAI